MGDTDLLWNIVLILIFLYAGGTVLSWMAGNAKGEITRGDSIAKQAALLIDQAEPGTTLFLDARIEISGNKVTANYGDTSKEYTFFSRYSVISREVEGGTEITVGQNE